MKTFNTKTANPKLVNSIIEGINKLLDNGKLQYETLGKDAVKPLDEGRNIYIDPSDEEKYDALNLLYSFITIKNEVADYNLYEFPGFEMNGQKMRLVVQTSKAAELAEKAEHIEEALRDYGVKFPAQLYALKEAYKGKNLPGRDFPPPVPKTMEKTDEEYEKYLEEYYKARGDKKESDGLSFRKPYEHEQIDYKKSDEKKDDFTSEYYQDQLELHAKGKGETKKAPIGERLKVAVKSLPNPHLKEKWDKVTNSINWKKNKSKVIKIAALSAGVVGAGAILAANPIAGAMVITLAGSFALGKYLRKKIEERNARKRIDKEEAEAKRKAEEEAKKRAERDKEKEKEQTDGAPTRVQTGEPVQKPGQPVDPESGVVPPTTGNTAEPSFDDFTEDMVYDVSKLSEAELDLAADNAEYNRLSGELTGVRLRISQFEGQALTPEQDEQLKGLKVQEIKIMQDRLKIAQRLVEKQELLLSNLEHSGRTR